MILQHTDRDILKPKQKQNNFIFNLAKSLKNLNNYFNYIHNYMHINNVK